MPEPSLNQAYATLGLEPDCPWDDVRRQHKRLAFAWHPDRHVATPDANKALERAKEINAAFEVLSKYYRAQARAEHHVPETDARPEHPTAQDLPPFPPEISRSPATHATSTSVLAAVSISVLVFWALARLAVEPVAEVAPGSLMDNVTGANGAPYGGGSTGMTEGGFDGLRTDANTGDKQITYGSTRDEVRRILGAPAAEGDAQWTYGPSQIYFKDGRVSGWYLSPLQPLKVKEK